MTNAEPAQEARVALFFWSVSLSEVFHVPFTARMRWPVESHPPGRTLAGNLLEEKVMICYD